MLGIMMTGESESSGQPAKPGLPEMAIKIVIIIICLCVLFLCL